MRFGKLLFLLGTVFGMGLMLFLLQFWNPDEGDDIEHYRRVRDLVQNTFVGDVDEEVLLGTALRGMLTSLDPYSDYYLAAQTEELNRDTSGKTVGIGVIMRYIDGPQILFPLSDSPALRAGLQVGDKILAIDDISTVEMPTEELSALLRREPGSSIRMTVKGLDETVRELVVKPNEVQIPSVSRTAIVDKERGIGYLALTSFTNRTAEELDAAIEWLQTQGMKGLILDLRGNPGGVLSETVEITNRFVRKGPLTSTRGRDGSHVDYADPELALYFGLPLALLVDRDSASASEVFAGALQDHRVAVLIGEATYGKGLVQTISRFPRRNAVAKVTTSYYYTPALRNVHRSNDGNAYGLMPDFPVPSTDEERKAIFIFLHRTFEPPPAALSTLQSWEAEIGLKLVVERPLDAQLDAALSIFAGKFPG
ncbi:MAG: carboxyl-terminal processing protease [Planctomycetota bacterium]|jgi:carboxyl-terminal processing protease